MSKNGNKQIEWYRTDVGELSSDEFLILTQMMGEQYTYRFLKLREAIYKEGFFLLWNYKNARSYCIINQCQENDMVELIKNACVCGLLNQSMFEWYGVLTSLKIQINYFSVAMRRKGEVITYEYLVIPKSSHKRFLPDMITVVNLNDDVLDNKKLPNINRPKKKLNIISTPDLFSPATEVHEMIDISYSQDEKEELIREFTSNTPMKIPPQNPPEIKKEIPLAITVWADIVKYANRDPSTLSDDDKGQDFSIKHWQSYTKLINTINELYTSLHSNKSPINWKQWADYNKRIEKIPKNKWPSLDQLYGGLKNMAGAGIEEKAGMMVKLEKYVEWFIDPNHGKPEVKHPSPNVKMLSDARNK